MLGSKDEARTILASWDSYGYPQPCPVSYLPTI